MRFVDRVVRLARADAHAVVDHLEERSLLLKQHLREAELELDRKRARVEALEEEARRLGDAADSEEARIAALDADIELALAQDRGELARFAVRRLIPRRRALAALRERAAEVEADRERLAERLAAQQSELEELRSRVRARLAADEERGPFDTCGQAVADEAAVADEEVELELLRRARRAEGGTA